MKMKKFTMITLCPNESVHTEMRNYIQYYIEQASKHVFLLKEGHCYGVNMTDIVQIIWQVLRF